MIKQIWVCMCMILLIACHNTSDHSIKRPARDTTGLNVKQLVPDTSHHIGTIAGITDGLTHELTGVNKMQSIEFAFVKLLTIHRKTLLEIAQVEKSVGNEVEAVRLSDILMENSHRILEELSSVQLSDTLVQTEHKLAYHIPIAENKFDEMVHQGIPDDQSFLQMSIIIERSEILLGRSYLKEGKVAYLRRIAETLVKKNLKEISRLMAAQKK